MKLLIVRHGPAGDREAFARRGLQDERRPLTPEGRRKTAKAMEGLAWAAPRPSLVLTSPLDRAAQTARILAERLKTPAPVAAGELKPSSSYPGLAARLAREAGPVVAVVGHEPHLSGLASYLLTGSQKAALELKKAGACLLEFEGGPPAAGRGRLLWCLTPSQLRRLARRN